jgi:hypothetical protein
MTFAHRFSNSLSCTLTVEDGKNLVRSIEWTGEPKPKHLGEFVRFMHLVNREIADTLGVAISYEVESGPRVECWLYEPFRVPRLEKTTRPMAA